MQNTPSSPGRSSSSIPIAPERRTCSILGISLVLGPPVVAFDLAQNSLASKHSRTFQSLLSLSVLNYASIGLLSLCNLNYKKTKRGYPKFDSITIRRNQLYTWQLLRRNPLSIRHLKPLRQGIILPQLHQLRRNPNRPSLTLRYLAAKPLSSLGKLIRNR